MYFANNFKLANFTSRIGATMLKGIALGLFLACSITPAYAVSRSGSACADAIDNYKREALALVGLCSGQDQFSAFCIAKRAVTHMARDNAHAVCSQMSSNSIDDIVIEYVGDIFNL